MITYLRAIDYLDAIASLSKRSVGGAPHGIWWRHSDGTALTYAEFQAGTIVGPPQIPAPVPILEPAGPAGDKSGSLFYKILLGPVTYHGTSYHQMPQGGYFLTSSAMKSGTGTDPAPGTILYTLSDGMTTVTGRQIQADLLEWLKAGAPENGTASHPRPARVHAGASARVDARELMAVPMTGRGEDWLRTTLAMAVELEHSTIPPYLCALWTIKNPNNAVRKLIQQVVEEEMGHMALASNMLAALGGTPPIGDPGFVPSYPGPLPGGVRPKRAPDLKVTLAGFSVPLVRDVFMNIEAPDFDPIEIRPEAFQAPALADEQPTYPSIGEFYAAIRVAFEALDPQVSFPTDKQVDFSGFRNPVNKVFPIADVADALKAVDQIRDQGEGTTASPTDLTNSELAHYYLFEQVVKGKEYIRKDGHWVESTTPFPPPPAFSLIPMAPIPEGGYRNVPDEAAAAIQAFNVAYKGMLTVLKSVWILDRANSQRALTRAIQQMGNLATLADAIFAFEIGAGPAVYGPTFQI